MKDPLVPVIEMEYSPAVELEHVRIAVPGEGGIVRLFGLREQLTPAGADVTRLTRALDPPIGLTVIAKAPVDPGLTVSTEGPAEIPKSLKTFTVNVEV